MSTACKKPLPNGGGCGQCQYCRINRKMDKVNLLKIEHSLRPHAFFVTLTYDDTCIPVFKNGNATLWYPDLVNFCKRLRSSLPNPVKIFAVGEYGGKLFGNPGASRSIHPHYHLAIFSKDPSIHKVIRKICQTRWNLGHVHILLLSGGLCDYIAGYITKKLTNERSMKAVMGLDITPEFSFGRGIGDIHEQIMTVQEQQGKVEKIRVGDRVVVLPKYLRDKVKRKFLEFGLDLKTSEGRAELELRKEIAREESFKEMQLRREKKDKEATLAAGTDNIYDARRIVRQAALHLFEVKMNLLQSTKRKKVL